MPALKNYKFSLRAKYNRNFKISVILALALLIAAFKFAPQGGVKNETTILTQDIIKVENIENTIQKPKPPPPPLVLDPVVYFDDELIEDIELDDIEINTDEKFLPPPPPPSESNIDFTDEPFYEYPEELPQPVGGIKALQEKVHYTEIARRAGIEGTVFVEAKIDKNGNVVDAFVKKGIGGGLNESALNAVLQTKFHPGKQRGKPVNVKIVIPIRFVLK